MLFEIKSDLRKDAFRADSRLEPSHWETSLQGHAVSHWLGAHLESALKFNQQNVSASMNWYPNRNRTVVPNARDDIAFLEAELQMKYFPEGPVS